MRRSIVGLTDKVGLQTPLGLFISFAFLNLCPPVIISRSQYFQETDSATRLANKARKINKTFFICCSIIMEVGNPNKFTNS